MSQASKLDLENDDVFTLETDRESVRSYFDGQDLNEIIPNLDDTLDNAQAKAEDGGAWIVIRIKP